MLYRSIKYKQANIFLWQELLKFHRKADWKHGQYEHDKTIFCDFAIDDSEQIRFYYAVEQGKLIFRSIVLHTFDEEMTNNILVLASHFNSLLTRGVVKVLLHQNSVTCYYSRDSFIYALFPDAIVDDTAFHYNLSKDVYWAFTNMLKTGEDPVFVFSELMRMKEAQESNS